MSKRVVVIRSVTYHSLPLEGVLGEGKLGAVLRVELTVPATESKDEAVFGHKEWLGEVLLVVPYHDVTLELKE